MNNGTSTVKRTRRTKVEILKIQEAMVAVLRDDRPQSVRHLYYRLVAHGFVEKTETGYRTVQAQCLKMRQAGRLPWSWVSDGTRWRRQLQTYDSAAEAVRHVAQTYRRDLWRRTPVYVEVWCESDSMAGVIVEETEQYGVSLMVSRGFASASYLYQAAQEIKEQGRPAYLYYVGDWDPSGKMIPEKIEAALRAFAPGAEIHFERLLVTPGQIRIWSLPTKPAKKTTHAKGFTGRTVECEAVPAAVSRTLVHNAIAKHLDQRHVETMTAAEESEAAYLKQVAKILEGEAV